MEILRSTAILSSITGQKDMDTAGSGNEQVPEEEEDIDLAAPVVKEAESASKSSRMSKSHRHASPDSAQHQFIGNGSMEMAADQREPDDGADHQEVDQMPSPGEVEPWGESQVMEEYGHYEQKFLPENSMPLSSLSLRGTLDQRGRSKALPVLKEASMAFQKDPAHASSRYGGTGSGTRPLSIFTGFTGHKRERRSEKYAQDLQDLCSSPSPTGSPLGTSIPAPSVYSEPEDYLSPVSSPPVSSPYVPLASITILKLTGMNSGSAIDTAQHTIKGDDLKQLGSDQGNNSSELAHDQFYPSPLQPSSRERTQEGTTLQPQSSPFHRQGVQSGSRSSTSIHKYGSETSSQEVGIDMGLTDLGSGLGHTIMIPQHAVDIPAGSSGGIVSTALHRPMQEKGKGKQAGQMENTSKRRLQQRDLSDSSDSEEVPSKRRKTGPKLSFGVSVSGVALQPKNAHKK